MAKRKRSRKKKAVGWRTHKTWSKAGLSRERGHIPVALLKSRLAKMPRHMHELAALIKRRQATGE